MILARDKQLEEGAATVASRGEYIAALSSDALEVFIKMVKEANPKDRDALYSNMADFDELYNTLKSQLLKARTEVATKARYAKQYEVAKNKAETLGGYFNGVLLNE